MNPVFVSVLVGGLVVASMSSCTIAAYEVEHGTVITTERPPPPKDEEPPPAPAVAYTWVPGYWYWSGAGYVWVGGRWARPPASGHIWVRSGWVVVDGRYRYIPGRWAPPARVPTHQYIYRSPRVYRR